MINIYSLMSLFLLHYLADWLAQTRWMAVNKSSWWKTGEGFKALATHVGLYSLVMSLGMGLFSSNKIIFLWFVITFVTHFITDAITSQFTTRWFFFEMFAPLWWIPKWENRSKFFNTIGADQLIHMVTLTWTLKILSGM